MLPVFYPALSSICNVTISCSQESMEINNWDEDKAGAACYWLELIYYTNSRFIHTKVNGERENVLHKSECARIQVQISIWLGWGLSLETTPLLPSRLSNPLDQRLWAPCRMTTKLEGRERLDVRMNEEEENISWATIRKKIRAPKTMRQKTPKPIPLNTNVFY